MALGPRWGLCTLTTRGRLWSTKIISTIRWIRTSRSSIHNSLSPGGAGTHWAGEEKRLFECEMTEAEATMSEGGGGGGHLRWLCLYGARALHLAVCSCSVQCTGYSVACTVYSARCSLYSAQVYSVQCILNSAQCTVHSVQCTVHCAHSAQRAACAAHYKCCGF